MALASSSSSAAAQRLLASADRSSEPSSLAQPPRSGTASRAASIPSLQPSVSSSPQTTPSSSSSSFFSLLPFTASNNTLAPSRGALDASRMLAGTPVRSSLSRASLEATLRPEDVGGAWIRAIPDPFGSGRSVIERSVEEDEEEEEEESGEFDAAADTSAGQDGLLQRSQSSSSSSSSSSSGGLQRGTSSSKPSTQQQQQQHPAPAPPASSFAAAAAAAASASFASRERRATGGSAVPPSPSLKHLQHTSQLHNHSHAQLLMLRRAASSSSSSSSSFSAAVHSSPPPLVKNPTVAGPARLGRTPGPPAVALEPSARPALAVPWGRGFAPAANLVTSADAVVRTATPDAALWVMDQTPSTASIPRTAPHSDTALPAISAGLRRMRMQPSG